jgi:hypothetical protein
VTTFERCPVPGCENPAGSGKTAACSLSHAGKLAWAARRPATAATRPAPRPAPAAEKQHVSKAQKRAEEQRRSEFHGRLDQALREREARVAAAYRTRH